MGVSGALVIVLMAIGGALRLRSRTELLYISFITVSLTLASFSDIYLLSGWEHWTEHVHHRTAVAMAIGTFVTAGLPGVSPTTDFARSLLAWQQVVDVVLVLALLAVVARRIERLPGRP